MTFDDMLNGEEPDDGDSTPSRRDRAGRRVSVLTVVGLVLILAGLSALGWVGYQYFGTNVVAERQFTKSKETLRQVWDTPPTSAPSTAQGEDPTDPLGSALPGDAVALLRVPDWGSGYEVPILKGTSVDVLAKGVGVYPSSVAPGEVGNFAIAGHRVTHGEPFARLLDLRPGAEIIIETRTKIFTYVMDNSPADLTVDEAAGWVLDPVPGSAPDTKPTKALLTLTTCQDLFHSPDRSIGFAHLGTTVNK